MTSAFVPKEVSNMVKVYVFFDFNDFPDHKSLRNYKRQTENKISNSIDRFLYGYETMSI